MVLSLKSIVNHRILTLLISYIDLFCILERLRVQFYFVRVHHV